MSNDKVQKYLRYHSFIKRLLLIVGLWPRNDPNILYKLLPFFHLFVIMSVILGAMLYVIIHRSNISTITRGLSIMTSCGTAILKIICLMINRDDVNVLHNTLYLRFNRMLQDQQFPTTILKDFSIFRNLTWSFSFFVMMALSLTGVTPIVSLISQHLQSVDPIIYPVVYPTAYPWSVDPPGVRYVIHFLIELFTLVPLFCVSPSIDSLFMMYGFQMSGQFREMSRRLMNVDKMTDDRKAVRECVLQHQSIMKCRDMIQKIYGPIILYIITTNAITLCTFIFQISQMDVMSLWTIITFAAYVMLKIVQTYMYAYTGTFLTSESESYREAIYNANWLMNRRFMTSSLIMLCQKPIILTAFNFSVVSLNIFVKVLNTTLSYFFLLRTIS